MTAPVPALPSVSLGNTASDIGSGATSLVNGLVAQRQRAAQIAMQQALAQANIGRLNAQAGLAGAQTGLVGQQTTTDTHANEPAGNDQLLQVRHYWQQAPDQVLSNMTRGEADKFIDRLSSMSMMGARFDAGEQDKVRQSYLSASKPAKMSIDAYRETLNAYNMAAHSGNPVAAEGMLLSWLKARTNRMNQVEINRISSLGGIQNMATRLASYATGQVPIDPVMLKNFLDAATPGGAAHVQDYENLRQNYSRLAVSKGWNPSDIVMDDDYGQDIPGLEQSVLAGQPQAGGPAPVGGSALIQDYRNRKGAH